MYRAAKDVEHAHRLMLDFDRMTKMGAPISSVPLKHACRVWGRVIGQPQQTERSTQQLHASGVSEGERMG